MKLPKVSAQRGLALIVFVLYAAFLLKAVLFKNPAGLVSLEAFSIEGIRFRLLHTSNFMPFKTILFYLSGSQGSFVTISNLAGNLVGFAPLGFLLPHVFPKLGTFRHFASVSFMVSLLLEGVQPVIGLGTFDVDDLLLNLIGAIVGWLVYRTVTTLLGRVGRGETDHVYKVPCGTLPRSADL